MVLHIAHQFCNGCLVLWSMSIKRAGCELCSAVAGADEGTWQTCYHDLPLLSQQNVLQQHGAYIDSLVNNNLNMYRISINLLLLTNNLSEDEEPH